MTRVILMISNVATKFNYDRRAHPQHMVTGLNAPQLDIPEFVTGRSTQNKPLAQQFTQPQNMTTQISPGKNLSVVEQTPQRLKSVLGSPINKVAKAKGGIASQ